MSNTNYVLSIGLVSALSALGGCAASSEAGCVADTDCPGMGRCLDQQCVVFMTERPDAQATPDASVAPMGDAMATPTEDASIPDAMVDTTPDADLPPPILAPACTMPSCNRCSDRFPSARICETFDEPFGWERVQRDGATIERNTLRFASGGGALRVQSPADGTTHYRQTLNPRIQSGPIYARVYAYLPAGPPISNYAVLVNFRERATGRKISLDIANGDRLQATAGPMGASASGRTTMARDRWVCLELFADLAVGNDIGSVGVSADGSPIASRDSQLVHAGGGFDEVWVGVRASPDNRAPVDIYLDEFVVSTSPIGCSDVMFTPLR
ncbi:MAG: hypothetical protein AAGF12_32970 [Myxococcota bacterium]